MNVYEDKRGIMFMLYCTSSGHKWTT